MKVIPQSSGKLLFVLVRKSPSMSTSDFVCFSCLSCLPLCCVMVSFFSFLFTFSLSPSLIPEPVKSWPTAEYFLLYTSCIRYCPSLPVFFLYTFVASVWRGWALRPSVTLSNTSQLYLLPFLVTRHPSHTRFFFTNSFTHLFLPSPPVPSFISLPPNILHYTHLSLSSHRPRVSP